MELKYIIFALAACFGIPLGVIATYLDERFLKLMMIFMFIGTLTSIDVNFSSLEVYRGTTRGFSVSMTDLAAVILFLGMCLRSKYKITFFPPAWYLFVIYFVLSLISSFKAAPILSYFELFKMVWLYFSYLVLYNYLRVEFDIKTILSVIAFSCIYCFMLALYQKYVQGLYQVRGPFPHQNSFAMYAGVWGAFLLPIILEMRMKTLRYATLLFSYLCCGASVVFTYSRGGLITFSAATALCFGSTLAFRPLLQRKLWTLTVLATCGMIGLGYALPRILDRFINAPTSSRSDRVELIKDATKMANENITGVGLNNFCYVLNKDWHKNVPPREMDFDSFPRQIVESVFFLIAAESGWPAMVSYMLIMFYFYFRMVRCGWKNRKNDIFAPALGIVCALTLLFGSSFLEWVLRQPRNAIQLIFLYAIAAALPEFVRKLKTKEVKHEKAITPVC